MSIGTTGEDVRQALNGAAKTTTITEAKQLIERAERDVESILSELQRATGLGVAYITWEHTATFDDGTRVSKIHIDTSFP